MSRPLTYEPMPEGDRALCTKGEIARPYRVSEETIARWVRLGRIPAVRPGHRTLRFDRTAVAVALEARSTED